MQDDMLLQSTALGLHAAAIMDLVAFSHVHDLSNDTFRGFVQANDVADTTRGLTMFKLFPAGSKESPALILVQRLSRKWLNLSETMANTGSMCIRGTTRMIKRCYMKSSLLRTENLWELFLK